MADYYSILKRTIASLPESNGAARRSVYSRARNAIVNQLKAYEPPLSPSEITAEQLRLEEAIRKVEAEAARESLGLSPSPGASASAPTPRSSSYAAQQPRAPEPQGVESTPEVTKVPEASAPSAPEVSVSAPEVKAPEDVRPADPVPGALGSEAKSSEARSVSSPVSSPVPHETPPVMPKTGPKDGPSTLDAQEGEPSQGSSFAETSEATGDTTADSDAEIPSPLKDTLSEAEQLGAAANKAVRNVKEAVDPAQEKRSGVVIDARKEPAFRGSIRTGEEGVDGEGGDTDEDMPSLFADRHEPVPVPQDRSKRERPSASDALRGSGAGRIVPMALAGVLVLVVLGAAAYFFLPSEDQALVSRQDTRAEDTQPSDLQPNSVPSQALVAEEPSDTGTSAKNTDRLLDDSGGEVVAPDARTVTTTTISPQPSTPVASAPASPGAASTGASSAIPLVEPARPSVEGTQGDLASITQPGAGASASAPAPSGAQRSILYEEGEDTSGAGTASQGAVVWGLKEETDLNGNKLSVLTAQVDIPERGVKVDIRIKPNDDTSLPASHLVEIEYAFPDGFAAGDVVNVPGLVMKPTEEARGDALIGASVKVSPGIFWIALSNDIDKEERNMGLLSGRGWIDIPMLYENGKRGILTLEKGTTGNDVVNKAVASWQGE